MKKILTAVLMFTMMLGFCNFTACAEGETIIEVEVLEAGFCMKTAVGYIKNESRTTINGSTTEKVTYFPLDYTPNEGKMLFVIRANICNISENSINIDQELIGAADFPGKDAVRVKTYAYQNPNSASAKTLLPGESTPAILVSQVSGDYVAGFDGCTVAVGGASVSFDREDVPWKDSVVFDGPKSVTIVDGVEVTEGNENEIMSTQEAQTATYDKNAPVAIVEDCKIENIQANSFVLHSKVRNVADRDFTYVHIRYQLLDSKGDALANLSQTVQTLPAGSAVWTGNYTVEDVNIEDVHAIVFTGSTYEEYGQPLAVNVPLKENTTFYVSALVKGEECAMGDIISTDSVNIKLTDISFEPFIIGSTTYFPAESDMIFALLEIELENVSKTRIAVTDFLNVTIDFNDGFLFGTADYESILLDEKGDMRIFVYAKQGRGENMGLSPLTSQTYTLAIPCARLVGEDQESPLSVKFCLPDEGAEKIFTCVVR